MTDSANQKLDEDKLRLEIEKQRFEERKYEALAEFRAEELAKLRADREKAESEAKELRTPFFQKPSIITAFFQGIALVIAVASALISLSAWTALRDAATAKRDMDAAQTAATIAKNEQAAAESKSRAAESAARNAEQEEAAAQKLRSAAETDARMAPVIQILADLKESKYYPRNFSSETAPDADEGESNPEIKSLFASIGTKRKAIDLERIEYLKNYALLNTEPLGVRLAVLRVLYEVAKRVEYAAVLRADRLRGEFIEVVTSVRSGEVDDYALDSLRDLIPDLRESSIIICHDYYEKYAADLGYEDGEGFRGSLETSIAGSLYFQKREGGEMDTDNRDCASAGWSLLSPEADQWRYDHWRDALQVVVDERGMRQFSDISPVPEFIEVVRHFHDGNPRPADQPGEIVFDIGVKSGEPKVPVTWKYSMSGWRAAKSAGDDPPNLEEVDATAAITAINNWLSNNSDVVDVLNDSHRDHWLQNNCDPKLLQALLTNRFIGRHSIKKYCEFSPLRLAR